MMVDVDMTKNPADAERVREVYALLLDAVEGGTMACSHQGRAWLRGALALLDMPTGAPAVETSAPAAA